MAIDDIMKKIYELSEEGQDKIREYVNRLHDKHTEKEELVKIKEEMNDGEYIKSEYMDKDDIYEVVDKIEKERLQGLKQGKLCDLLDEHYN